MIQIGGAAQLMFRRSFSPSFLIVCLGIAASLLVYAAPSACSGSPQQPPVRVSLRDSGKTVALSVGQELIVSLQLGPYDDDSWRVIPNSGAALKLIGDDMRYPRDSTARKNKSQEFRFRRESPGTSHLVLERSYSSKPMILEVVDR